MKIDISTILIIWILSSTTIPLLKSDYIIENITVLNSTSTELSISWTVLTNQSISLIEYYNITLQPNIILNSTLVFQVFPLQVVNLTNNTFEFHVNGLEEFISYNIRVIIVTSAAEVFTSRASINATTNKAAPTGAPQNVMSLAIYSTTIKVYWYPPPSIDQNGLITHYTLIFVGTFFNNSNGSVDINATGGYPATSLQGPHNITGLHEYNNYTIEIRAVNAICNGPLSAIVTQLTNQAAPDASPLNLIGGTVNSSTICLSWLPPPGVNQNGPITQYNISYTGIQFDTSLRFIIFVVSPVLYPANSVQYSYNLTGLEAYTDYNITISAINGAGIGPATVPVLATTDAEAPDAAPINITAIAIDSTRIQVSWEPPPPINQNGEISCYNITFFGFPFDTVPQFYINYIVSIYPDNTTYTRILIGLQEYNNYTVSISAVNTVGKGPASQGITVLTGIGASDQPPQSLITRPINATSIGVSWVPPPPPNQNGPILSYNITYRGVIYDTTLRSVLFQVAQPTYPTNSTGQVTIGKLSQYTDYTIGVSAVTLGGLGVFGFTRQRTDEAAPTSSPFIIQISSISATEVSISWTPPLNTDQNGIITHYVIYYTASLFSNLTLYVTYRLDSPSYPDTGTYTESITGLEEYVLYNFSIQAFTAVGASPNSFEETLKTIQAVPGAPVLLTVTPLNSLEVTVQWKHPDKIDQNGPIVEYHIGYIISMSSVEIEFYLPAPIIYPADPSIPLNTTVQVELEQGVYVWYVSAENGAGISAKSNNITRTVANNALSIAAISVTASIGGCCLIIILPIALIYATVLLLLYCRRSRTTKINTIEATTVEMKSRTIFSNQCGLKELEKQGVTREAIYAVIGDNQFSSEGAAGGSVVVTVENPIEIPKDDMELEIPKEDELGLEIPKDEVRLEIPKDEVGLKIPETDEEGLSTSLPIGNEGTDPPTVVITAADISGGYISEEIVNDESKLMENTEEHSLGTVGPGEMPLGDEDSEHFYDDTAQDQESQII